MYIPSWPCPTASQFSLAARASLPFPLEARRQYFYVARNGIYHLFRSLGLRASENVLVPDYHSSNETAAIRAAGVPIRFYPIHKNLELDRDAVSHLCTSETRALYVIHFIGWPQPMEWITDFCRRRGLLLIEDCALSFLSEYQGQPLGSFGDYAVHCLYKTLPLPNGAVLSGPRLNLDALRTVRPGTVAVVGRSAELLLESFRSACPGPGAALATLKAAIGQGLTFASVERERVGNIGFDIEKVDTEMSRGCHRLLAHLNYELIRERRRHNFLRLGQLLNENVTTLPVDLAPGICPLFFPILIENKTAVAADLRKRGIGVVEFWNQGDPAADEEGTARFLRRHVIELPIHQNVTERQLEDIAREVIARTRPVENVAAERSLCCASS